MKTSASRSEPVRRELPKARSGISGLDEITGGGLPQRPAHAGLRQRRLRQDAARGMEFLVRGATEFGEPGVFMAFEETGRGTGAERALARLRPRRAAPSSASSLVDYVHIERSEIEETGEYDLEGLFIRLGHAIDTIGAKRVVLDTLEALFGGLANDGDPARRAAPAVPLAQGQGRHGDHHRRARRRHADAPRARGIRLRLRDPARPSRDRAGLDAAPAHRQVPRHHARHERVSVPDRRARHLACCR